MTENDFLRIQTKLKNFRFSSMQYIQYSDVMEYQIIKENETLILLYGYHHEAKCNEYHWAANLATDIIHSIDNHSKCLITFIPREWVSSFQQAGFVIHSEWHDYFMPSLETIPTYEEADMLTENECEEASLVTLSCRGLSRGFSGQTPEWIKDWIDNSEENSKDSGVFQKAILVERNESKEIVGICCTGTYSHESEKGAISWIREVAVKPEYQRKGIARSLIIKALSYGKSFGAKRAFLAADECNTYAIHLYQSIGFKPSSENSQIDMIRE